MYGNTDGSWAAWTAAAIIQWGHPFDLSPYNMLGGMGSMFAPFLPWLNPGALSLGLPFDEGAKYVISYTFYVLEVLVSIIFLMRSIGLSPLRSILVAQIYTIVFFPPMSEWFVALTWYSMAPFNAHIVSIASITLCLFLKAGTYSRAGNLACAAGVGALVLCAIYSAPVSLLTYVPVYGFMTFAIMINTPAARRELLWKAGLVGALLIFLWALGVGDYLSVTREMSARMDKLALTANSFSNSSAIDLLRDAWRQHDTCDRPQELLCRKLPIFWFHLLAIGGAVAGLLNESPKLRWMAGSFLTYYALVHAWDFVSTVGLFGGLHIISAPFLVWASYPFFALFITVLICSFYDFLRYLLALTASTNKAESSPRPGWLSRTLVSLQARWLVPLAMLSALIVPLCAYQLWRIDLRPLQPPKQSPSRNSIFGTSPAREPVVGAITRYLVEQASITPGTPFRGYTVTYFGDPAGHIRKHLKSPSQKEMGWLVVVETRQYMDTHYGNRFREMDLWQFGIPTVEEYGQWVTKQAHAFAVQLFSSPGDIFYGPFLNVNKLDLGLLPVIGVRFIVTDLELSDQGVSLRAKQQSPTAGPIYLYELSSPNLGTYSPTEVAKVQNFSAAMDYMRKNSRGLNRQAVVFEDLNGSFVPVSRSTMLAERDGFRVIAESAGSSLLVLPVQYSHCLEIAQEPGKSKRSPARLMRVNGIQTLLVFEREVNVAIRFDFGLLGHAGCRAEDARDIHLIDIRG